MRAIYIERFGGPEVVTLGALAPPVPRRGQVLIRVAAAGVNPRDLLLRAGRYQFRGLVGPFPIVLGSDVSGTVAAVGPGVEHVGVGDDVVALAPRMGAFAELIAVSAKTVARKPVAVSHVDAAALPCAGLTAVQALRMTGVTAGSTVVVNGASGGVGTYAVQIAAALGAQVTAVAREQHRQLCTSLGAQQFVDYASQTYDRLLAAQDVVFDAAGRSSFQVARRALRAGGQYVTTLPLPRTIGPSARRAMTTMAGLLPGKRSRVVLVRSRGDHLRVLLDWMQAGHIRSVVDSVVPLEHVPDALDTTWRARSAGKVVVDVAAS